MHTFFHGWRRKAGVFTLVMALAMMGLWVRSTVKFDSVFFYCGSVRCGLSSVDSRIWFLKSTPLLGESLVTWFSQTRREPFDPMKDATVVWRKDWAGFHIGRYSRHLLNQTETGEFQATSCMVPHWCFVLALTLLSGYLILCQPRQPKKPGIDFSQRHQDTESDKHSSSTNNSDLPAVSP